MTKNPDFEKLLGRVFDEMRGSLREVLTPEEYATLRFDFVFHMTDWLDDLHRLNALEQAPGSIPKRDAARVLIGLLYHVIPHLNAAGRLLLDDVGDPFQGNEADQILAKVQKAEAETS